MIIKPGTPVKKTLVVGIVIIYLFGIFLMVYTKWVLFSLSTMILAYLLLLPRIIASCRTLIMDKDGCTVRFWRYKRHYRWEELELKQYVQYEGVWMRATKSHCNRAAEFCPKKVKVPRTWDAHLYSVWCHPLTFFFVYFPEPYEEYAKRTDTWTVIAYIADEQEFREKLKEWGVEMEETTRGGESQSKD